MVIPARFTHKVMSGPIQRIGLVTAASEKYSDSLRAMIASVRANWDEDLQIYVYDLGLSADTVALLSGIRAVTVCQIPEFCPHWRHHYTWKLWILSNAPLDAFLWLDAGIFVLRPLNNVLNRVSKEGAYFVPNYQDLAIEAPPAAVYAAGLTYAAIAGRSSISANIVGVNKRHPTFVVFERAYALGMVEKNLRACHSRHKHDQALISCVLYRLFPDYLFGDGQMYAGWRSPQQVNGQQCWAQRRAILKSDIEQLTLRMGLPGRFTPLNPAFHTPRHLRLGRWLKSFAARFFKRNSIHGLR
jgi:hypothetical protein